MLFPTADTYDKLKQLAERKPNTPELLLIINPQWELQVGRQLRPGGTQQAHLHRPGRYQLLVAVGHRSCGFCVFSCSAVLATAAATLWRGLGGLR